jgi:hypothetical protein
MSRNNFSEFTRFFPKGLNPLKIKEIQSGFCSKYYNLNYVGNLKSTQLKKLFRIFNSGLMQSLSIFGKWKGICFELERSEIRLENI